MAELYVVSDTGEKQLSSVVSTLEKEGHEVSTFQPPADPLTSRSSGNVPDLLVVDLSRGDARMFFERTWKLAGQFPVVLSKSDGMERSAGGALPDADAVYLPIQCDLDETLGLIRSVLSTWHKES